MIAMWDEHSEEKEKKEKLLHCGEDLSQNSLPHKHTPSQTWPKHKFYLFSQLPSLTHTNLHFHLLQQTFQQSKQPWSSCSSKVHPRLSLKPWKRRAKAWKTNSLKRFSPVPHLRRDFNRWAFLPPGSIPPVAPTGKHSSQLPSRQLNTQAEKKNQTLRRSHTRRTHKHTPWQTPC